MEPARIVCVGHHKNQLRDTKCDIPHFATRVWKRNLSMFHAINKHRRKEFLNRMFFQKILNFKELYVNAVLALIFTN